jgi:hypothetical protein
LYAGEPNAPPLAPLPKLDPQLPDQRDPETLPPAERMQRLLADAVRRREERIAALARTHGDRPAVAVSDDPALAAPRRERDRAWAALREALSEHLDRTPRPKRDPLEAARPRAQEAQIGGLTMANRVLAAECWRELLAADTKTDPTALAEGAALAAGIDPEQLTPGERPRAAYLSLWFLCESARHATGTERTRLVEQARAAQQAFATAHAGNQLAETSAALVQGL